MRKVVSKFALAASIVLAMAFTFSCSGSGESAFVGKWVPDEGSYGAYKSIELFKDGTGVAEEGMAISWKVVDKRFVMTMQGLPFSEAYDYEISGKKLTLTDDKGKKNTYVKQ